MVVPKYVYFMKGWNEFIWVVQTEYWRGEFVPFNRKLLKNEFSVIEQNRMQSGRYRPVELRTHYAAVAGDLLI